MSGEHVRDYADQYARAIELLLTSNSVEATNVIKTIPGGTVVPGVSPRILPLTLQAATFKRDRYTCRYCGRRTVIPPVLRRLSEIFGADFAYHLHGKMTHCHLAFWRDSSSCDHVVPVARGGSSDMSNLVTACYMCNSIKQNWLLEEIRWKLSPIEASDWDGLSLAYPSLLKLVPAPQAPYFNKWLVAIQHRHE